MMPEFGKLRKIRDQWRSTKEDGCHIDQDRRDRGETKRENLVVTYSEKCSWVLGVSSMSCVILGRQVTSSPLTSFVQFFTILTLLSAPLGKNPASSEMICVTTQGNLGDYCHTMWEKLGGSMCKHDWRTPNTIPRHCGWVGVAHRRGQLHQHRLSLSADTVQSLGGQPPLQVSVNQFLFDTYLLGRIKLLSIICSFSKLYDSFHNGVLKH